MLVDGSDSSTKLLFMIDDYLDVMFQCPNDVGI